MRLCEETQQNRNMFKFRWIIKSIMFGLSPPMEKREKSKNVRQYILMNVDFFIYLFLHKEYHLFSQKSESSLEQ